MKLTITSKFNKKIDINEVTAFDIAAGKIFVEYKELNGKFAAKSFALKDYDVTFEGNK